MTLYRMNYKSTIVTFPNMSPCNKYETAGQYTSIISTCQIIFFQNYRLSFIFRSNILETATSHGEIHSNQKEKTTKNNTLRHPYSQPTKQAYSLTIININKRFIATFSKLNFLFQVNIFLDLWQVLKLKRSNLIFTQIKCIILSMT